MAASRPNRIAEVSCFEPLARAAYFARGLTSGKGWCNDKNNDE